MFHVLKYVFQVKVINLNLNSPVESPPKPPHKTRNINYDMFRRLIRLGLAQRLQGLGHALRPRVIHRAVGQGQHRVPHQRLGQQPGQAGGGDKLYHRYTSRTAG